MHKRNSVALDRTNHAGARRVVLLAGLFMTFACAANADAIRSSSSYGIQFDSIAAGSAAMSSASYSQPQTIVGAEVLWANYVNSSFSFQPTGVIMFPDGSSSVMGWRNY